MDEDFSGAGEAEMETRGSAEREISLEEVRERVAAARPALERHSKELEGLHPRGPVFLRELFGALDGLTGRLGGELGVLEEARSRALEAGLAGEIGAYLERMGRRVAMIDALEEEDEEVMRGLRRAYEGERVERLGRAHVVLRRAEAANKLNAALLGRYGVDGAMAREAGRLLAALGAAPAGMVELEEAVERAMVRIAQARWIALAHREEHPALWEALSRA